VKNPKKITIGIIGGRGILGKIFHSNFETVGFNVLISGRKPDDQKVLSTNDLIRRSDIVIVSVFLKSAEKVLREIVPKMRKNQLLADFTSVKKTPLEIMKKAKSEIIGLHPMFGEVANLRGKNIFAVVERDGKLWRILKKSFEEFGLRIHEISAEKHDELAAIHQSLTHLISLAFAEILLKNKIPPEKIFKIASPSTQLFLLTTGRTLNQNLEMYTDISLQNQKVTKTIRMFTKIFAEIANTVETKNHDELLKKFELAKNFFGEWSNFASVKSSQIFESLSSSSRPKKNGSKKMTKNAIAILGKNTQTELAAKEFLSRQKLKNPLVGITTNSEIFTAVTKKKVKFGIIPIENSAVGLVRETLLNLFESSGKIKIFAEFERKIVHTLISRESKISAIEKVFTHPQAAAQSAKFLAKNLPRTEIIAVENAGRALELARESTNSAAISPAEFAENESEILARGIEDSAENVTRFVAIGRNFPITKNAKKTAFAFFFQKNRPGQLAAALTVFAEKNINLVRLESVPTTKKQGEFFFFVETEYSKNLPTALMNLRKIATVVELGNY